MCYIIGICAEFDENLCMEVLYDLLYNSSDVMICKCEYIFELNKNPSSNVNLINMGLIMEKTTNV